MYKETDEIRSGTKKSDEQGYKWLNRVLDRPDSEQRRSKVPDQKAGRGDPGQRPVAKVPPVNPADAEADAM